MIIGAVLYLVAVFCVAFAGSFFRQGYIALNPDIQPLIGIILMVAAVWFIYHGTNLIAYRSWAFPASPFCCAALESIQPYQDQR